MKIRHLNIQNFRGIKKLDWQITNAMVCLIGRGDSTKSTILDAIQYTLSPKWTLTFSDADFYNCEITNPIEIIVTVGELPENLINQDKFGNYLRGWSKETGLVDEPFDNTEGVISIKLKIDQTLEPIWVVVNDREIEGINISSNDRKQLGVSSLGTYVDQELSWGKFSSLSRLTGDDDNVSSVLADASRRAREAVAMAKLDELNTSASRASEVAKIFGVHPKNEYKVGLDAKLSITGQATLTLHDGNIPARLAGLGSRRLLTLAIQHQSVPEGGIMLIDEIEAGLEPHRLRHLLQILCPALNEKQQVFLTTHSSVTIEELNAEQLNIVHNKDGEIVIKSVDRSFQNLVRTAPEAFLAKKIIACEGATEVGFVRQLDRYWQRNEKSTPFAYLGAVPITYEKGGGSNMPNVALGFINLGYNVAFIGDSDIKLNPSEEELNRAGIKVILWDGNVSLEQRICLDLPYEYLNEFISEAVKCSEDNGGSNISVYDSIGSKFNMKSGNFNGNIKELSDRGFSEVEIRKSLGRCAKEKGWFKRISYGECLADVVLRHFDSMQDCDLLKKITLLKEWVHA